MDLLIDRVKAVPLLVVLSKRSQLTAAFSTWWGRYTGRLGITDNRKVFHSFRHSVKRGLREAGVDPALSDALQGHSAKDVAGRYGLDEEGSGFSLPVLHAALSRLTYPGLDLSRLAPGLGPQQQQGARLEDAQA